jgi:hypothetical protein
MRCCGAYPVEARAHFEIRGPAACGPVDQAMGKAIPVGEHEDARTVAELRQF